MDNTEFEHIRRLTLGHKKNRIAGCCVSDAAIENNGDVLIDTSDWGTVPESSFNFDYEYSITVEERFKDSVLLLLMKERFADVLAAREWFQKHNLPFKENTWQ